MGDCVYDHILQYLAMSDHIWPYLAISGNILQSADLVSRRVRPPAGGGFALPLPLPTAGPFPGHRQHTDTCARTHARG